MERYHIVISGLMGLVLFWAGFVYSNMGLSIIGISTFLMILSANMQLLNNKGETFFPD